MLGLQGKVAFIFGVASEDSIAWAICQSLAEAGVTLYLGYQKRFMSRVFQLKDKLPAIAGFYPLDVATDADTKEFFDALKIENLEIFIGSGPQFSQLFKLRGLPTTILIDKNGFEIGNIKQENVVEKMRLDNNWAEISNQIARGAIDGILDLVQAYSASKRQSKNKVE